MHRSFFILLIFSSLTRVLFSANGVTTVPLLRQPGSPANAALLGGNIAMGSNLWAIPANPAIGGLQDYTEASMSYQVLPFGFSAQNLDFIKPIGFGTVGGSIRYMGSPDIITYDDNFTKGNTNTSDIAFTGMYAIHFADISLGIAGSFIQSRIGDFSAKTVALDAGMIFYFDLPSIFEPGKNLNFGIAGAMKNLSPGIQYGEISNALPLSYSGAIFYNFTNFSYLETNLEIFVERFHAEEILYGPALEFKFPKYFVLRTAMTQVKSDGMANTALQFAAGASILVSVKGNVYDLGYSLKPTADAGMIHQFGLRVQFGGGEEWPFALDRMFANQGSSVKKEEAPSFVEPEDVNAAEEDRILLIQLRQSIYRFQKQKSRSPRDLNELLLYLNEYHVFEIPNPKKGRYRYNKRSGKLFIRE